MPELQRLSARLMLDARNTGHCVGLAHTEVFDDGRVDDNTVLLRQHRNVLRQRLHLILQMQVITCRCK